LDYKKLPLLSLHFITTAPPLVSAPQTKTRTLLLSLLFSGWQGETRQSRNASAAFPGLRQQNAPCPRACPPSPKTHPGPSVPGGEENRELKSSLIFPQLWASLLRRHWSDL